jgi:hypothetical protein
MFTDAPEYTALMAICSATHPIDRLDVVLAPARTLMLTAKSTRGQRVNAPGPNFADTGINWYARY